MGEVADARRPCEKKNVTPFGLGPLAASCIGKLHEIFAQAEATQKDLSALDARVLETVRGLGLTSLSAMLSNLGERGPGTLREIGADMVLGHVRFDCRYAALALGKPTSRQDGRRRARETEKGI